MQIITPRDIGIAEWRPFYTTVAEVAATRAGLMFVALTLHAQALKGPA